jgi:hypothetical protein
MKRSFPFSVTAILLFFSAVVFVTCAKEYSYEGGLGNASSSGTAVYTLNGAGGACLGAVIKGKYYISIALGATHSIQLQVNVTVAGSYTLSTNSVNGMRFSATGSFVNTGSQTITLTGNGTPVSAGSFSFHTAAGSQCSFIVEVEKEPAKLAAFTMAGAPGACTNAAVKGSYVSGRPLIVDNSVDIYVNVTDIGAYEINTDTLYGISFSASGTFTSTGLLKITLAGSGTPTAARNLVFTPMAGVSACTFNVTVVNPDPLAVYVLESGFGSPNPCTYTVAGNYIANSPLSTANYVTIKVFVTAIGNYTIATNTVNGMMFANTGAFVNLGVQNVILGGTGKPAGSGAYVFTPEIVGPHPLGGQACSFNVTVN